MEYSEKKRWTRIAFAIVISVALCGLMALISGCACGPSYPDKLVQEVEKNAVRADELAERYEQGEMSKEEVKKALEFHAISWERLLDLMSEEE